MTQTTRNILLLEKKIGMLDESFLKTYKKRFTYQNPYFLVCVAEVVCKLSSDNNLSREDMKLDELLSVVNERAKTLYLNSNISESFDGLI
jgi:hypothetical protein